MLLLRMLLLFCSPLFCVPVLALALLLAWVGLSTRQQIQRSHPHLLPLLLPLRGIYQAATVALILGSIGWGGALAQQRAGFVTYLSYWVTGPEKVQREREALAFTWRHPLILISVQDKGGPQRLLKALAFGDAKTSGALPVLVSPGDRAFYERFHQIIREGAGAVKPRLRPKSLRPSTPGERLELWESPLVLVVKKQRFGALQNLATDDLPWHSLHNRWTTQATTTDRPLRIGIPDPATTATGWLTLRALSEEYVSHEDGSIWTSGSPKRLTPRFTAWLNGFWATGKTSGGLVRLRKASIPLANQNSGTHDLTSAETLPQLLRGDNRLSAIVCEESVAAPFYLAHTDAVDLIYPKRTIATVSGVYLLPYRGLTAKQVAGGRAFLQFLAEQESAQANAPGRCAFYLRSFKASRGERHRLGQEVLGGESLLGLLPPALTYTPPRSETTVWTPSLDSPDADRGYTLVSDVLANLPTTPAIRN